jgi:pimeloyl-ACP methyl ester carboxylesterase
VPYAETEAGKLYYAVVDLVAPWENRRETIIFHHGIGASAGIWTAWLPHLLERYLTPQQRRALKAMLKTELESRRAT